MKKLILLIAAVTLMFAAPGTAARAAFLSYNYTFSYVLNTTSTTQGNDNDPTVSGTITLTQIALNSTSFAPTSLTLNAFTLPIDHKAADDLSIPAVTITSGASTLTGSNFTLSTPSSGVITTQGNAYASAGDNLKDASGNSFSFYLSKTSTVSDFGWTLKSTGTGGTFFSTDGVSYTPVAAPEPSAWALALVCLLPFAYLRGRMVRG